MRVLFWSQLTLVVLTATATGQQLPPAPVGIESSDSIPIAAKKAVESKLGPAILKINAVQELRVAVFPFGDESDKATVKLGMAPRVVQGEIETALRAFLSARAPGKFTVLQ